MKFMKNLANNLVSEISENRKKVIHKLLDRLRKFQKLCPE